MTQPDHLRRIRFWLAIFIIGLVLSGVTAFPLETELSWLVSILHAGWLQPISEFTGLLPWVERVDDALRNTNASYPFLAYGTDWLAFAHLTIAIAFVGPWIDPVRNKWLITFGLIACAGVIPLALIARPHPWHSASVAAYRLQLRSLWKCPAFTLQTVHPSARTRKNRVRATSR